MNEQQAITQAEHIDYMDDAEWRDDMSVECDLCQATVRPGEHVSGTCLDCHNGG